MTWTLVPVWLDYKAMQQSLIGMLDTDCGNSTAFLIEVFHKVSLGGITYVGSRQPAIPPERSRWQTVFCGICPSSFATKNRSTREWTAKSPRLCSVCRGEGRGSSKPQVFRISTRGKFAKTYFSLAAQRRSMVSYEPKSALARFGDIGPRLVSRPAIAFCYPR